MTHPPDDAPRDDRTHLPPPPKLTDEHLDRLERGLRQVARVPGRAEELLNAVLEVSKELQLDVVLHRITDTARDLIRARYGGLGVLSDTGRFCKVITSGFTAAGEPGAGQGGPLSGLCHEGLPLSVGNRTGQPPSTDLPPGHLRTSSLLAAPIRVRDKLYGHLYLGSKTSGEAFTTEDENLLTALAGAAGVAIENARLYQQVRQATEEFQRGILPELPRLEGLELQARYQPSTEAPRIGGDWYDLIRLPDRVPCLMVGDVMGHGIAAATVMSQISNMLRVIAFDEQEPPSRILNRLDTVLHELHGGPMATVIIARLEPHGDGRRLQWASAGHLPPLIATPDGRARYLAADIGLPLGVDPDLPRENHEEELRAGSTVVLHTDGLVEHRARPIDEGMDQAAGVAAALATTSLAELCDGLLVHSEATEGAFHDDVALLAARVTSTP
ncbi:GAF domain-containing SpoIIE family protein phosphatase [Streptomyces sp. NPDC007861]|uniref:PP2C family protein-serine/threonine phosphatase n=1 Tax=Streptomyces sp. NPDC007861 TaxID=3154893 RepID=UPI0033CA6B53